MPHADQALRERTVALETATHRLAGLEARAHTLTQLQERLEGGAGTEEWLKQRGLAGAPRLWQGIRIESGWEDALEAVLRERLNAIALAGLDHAARWFSEVPPGKATFYDTGDEHSAGVRRYPDASRCSAVVCSDPGLKAVVADWLHQVHVTHDAAAGLAARGSCPRARSLSRARARLHATA